MNRAYVSIVIPMYNSEKYIENCINSCFYQRTQFEFEIIVCDDCSTDRSLSVLQNIADGAHNVKVLRNDINQGVGKTRNRCIKAARGRYIMMLDSDDYIHPETIQIMTTCLELRDEIDCVKCDYVYVDNNGQRSSRISCLEVPIACGQLFRKSLIIELGLYDELSIGEEKRLEEQLGRRWRSVMHIELPLYRYRQHNMSITADFRGSRIYD